MQKNRFYKSSLSLALLGALIWASPSAIADDSSGFGVLFNYLFGTEQARSNAQTCTNVDNDPSLIGAVNSLFCHMEKDLGITGPTATGGVTKTFASGGGAMVVHAEVAGASGGASFGGYDFQGKIWVCAKTASVTCASASQFNRAVYVTWSFKADKTINKGVLFEDNGSFNGSPGNGLSVTYDLGSTTPTKTLNVTMVITTITPSIFMTASASRNSSNQLNVGLAQVQGTGGTAQTFEFAAAIDPKSNFTSASTYASAPSSPSGSVPSISSQTCFGRSASSTDWNYVSVSSANCASLPTLAYPTTTPSALVGTTAASMAPSTGTMANNPTAI